MRRVVAVILAVAILAGCLARDGGDGAAPATSGAPVRQGTAFIALGDMGTGGQAQAKVAAAIASWCAAHGCDFALGLGDLIYPAGASDPYDEQFETKFEQPYAALDFPFYMALGNHDVSGDPAGTGATAGEPLWYQAGDNEVAYAHRTDRTSSKWTQPARHYAFSVGDADFLALDTNVMLSYGAAVPPLSTEVDDQEQWLPGAVAAMDHTWRFAFGHHPYVSNGQHGDAGEFDGLPVPGLDGDHLKQVFERQLCGRVDFYVAGHDHHLQWLQPVDSCGATQFLVSGGGGADLYELRGDDPATWQEQAYGFFWLDVDGPTLHVVAVGDDGQALFERFVTKAG